MPIGEQSHIRFNTKHYLSVVIPTHARPQGVSEVVRQLARQNLNSDQYEILVVANFPEPALEISVAGLRLETGLNIRCLVAGRLGVNAARNLGMQEARGAYVLLLDDDCYPADREYLSRLLNLHCEYPQHIALGGAYLSLPELNLAGRHYNWICNQWLGAQFNEPRDTHRLIGGAVSYKLESLRELGFSFNEDIQYGGAETELHQRLFAAGQKLLYHHQLSVVHDPQMSNFDLVRKAFLQGYGKSLRPRVTEPPRKMGAWDSALKSTYQYFLYRKTFALGEWRGRSGATRAADWQLWLLLAGLCVLFLPQRSAWLRRTLFSADHSIHVWYWKLYHVASETYGLSRRIAGFIKGRIMRGYGLVMRGYGLMMRGYGWCQGVYGHSTGYIHAKSVRTYWTLYPIYYHLRRHWYNPLTLLDDSTMPFTYPDLDLKTEPVWVATIDGTWSEEKLSARLKKYRRLGITSVELEGFDHKIAQAIAGHGLGFHFVLKPFADLDLSRFPAQTEFVVSVTTSELCTQLDPVIHWVNSLPCKVSLHLKIDGLPQASVVKKFLSAMKAAKHVEKYSFQMPAPASAVKARGFEYFRWVHRFADQCQALALPWRHVYRFQEDPRYDLPVGPLVSDPPALSVIIPHHRDFTNLTHVLRCLENQVEDTPPFEVVVVDNAIEEYLLTGAQQAELIRLGTRLSLRLLQLRSESAGHYLSGNARNLGVLNSTGRGILFLDSDILVPAGFVRGVVEKLQTSDVLMAKRSMLNENFDPAAVSVADINPKQTYREDDYWEGYKRARQWTDLVDYWKYSCTYCFAVNRDNLVKAGPFDPQFMMYGYEDVDLGFRLFKRGLRFGFLDQKVFHLYPRKELHNYHHDEVKRLDALSRSALTFFLLRPEKMPFALCQGYFAPTFRNWVKQPYRKLVTSLRGRPRILDEEPAETVSLNAP